jgi:hypothetical protein
MREKVIKKKKGKKRGLDGHILTKKKKKVDHNVNGFILRRRVQ